jgi:hypothetical protein
MGLYQVRLELLEDNTALCSAALLRSLTVSSVWKPLRGPIHDWPLAICDAESVDKGDLIPADVVSLEQAIENMVVHYNPNQQWYYLSKQEPSELLIFRQADSEGRQGKWQCR